MDHPSSTPPSEQEPESPNADAGAPVDEPKADVPKADAPPAGAPKADAPKADAPTGDPTPEEAPAVGTGASGVAEPVAASDAAAAKDEDVPAEPPRDDDVVPAPTTQTGIEAEASSEGAEDAAASKDKAEGEGSQESKPKPKSRKKKPRPRKRQPRAPEAPPLSPELAQEVRQKARDIVLSKLKSDKEAASEALDALLDGTSLLYLARFQRKRTGGMDERRLRALREDFETIRAVEEARIRVREILRQRGALDDETLAALEKARAPGQMQDLAAPYLPVVAGRATVARGQGLQPLADAILGGTEEQPLSEVAKPFVPEGAEGPIIDQALAGARDIIAESVCLQPALRGKLRGLFRKEARLTVSLRSERKGDAGRYKHLVGFEERAAKVQPLKVLSIRRGEKDRVLISNIEPPEEMALPLVHEAAAGEGHPHAGFLRAAAEDGYRRILKPLLQNEMRLEVKERADALVLEGYERNLRNLLLGPTGGPVHTLGLRPDVTGGHRWAAVDGLGLPVGTGTLPHAQTAGKEACLAELAQVITTYEIDAIAVGTSGGRADALAIAKEAATAHERPVAVHEVQDGGTRALEGSGPLEFDDRPAVPADHRGALSLAQRYQDPLAELVRIDPKALALGPYMHDVHQGRLRRLLDDVIESCVAHVGPDPANAPAELMARVPGFTTKAAQGFDNWRRQYGPLRTKAALAAVEGVGPEVAEQAVGFLRLGDAEDPRDRTQLHPSQYAIAEQIASAVDSDLDQLFSDPRTRSQVRFDALTSDEIDLPTLKYVLFQATAGQEDPRPIRREMIPPPPEINLNTLQPGLQVQARVLRAVSFGVFVDCGMGVDALIPVAHIGDRPGVEPSTIAPVGAVVVARVLEVDARKKKLTLSLRSDRGGHARGGGHRGGRGGYQGDRRGGGVGGGGRGGDRRGGGSGPRRTGERQGERAGAGPRMFSAARGPGSSAGGSGDRDRGAGGGGRGGSGGGRGGSGGGSGGGGGRGQGQRGGRGPRREGGRPRQGGGYGGPMGMGLSGGRGRRDDRRGPRERGPRRISLAADDPKSKQPDVVDESKLSPEELMQRKLDEMKRKLQGDD